MTLLETLIYAAILSLILAVMVQNMISVVRTHRLVKLKQSLEASAVISMERMVREIRGARSVDIAGSTFGTSPGLLKLNGVDDGVSYTLEFGVAGNAVTLKKDSDPAGALTVQGINVDSLIFRHLATTTAEGIRIEMALSGGASDESRTMQLYDFAVLRDAY